MGIETWRDTAKRTIARVIQENPDADYKTFKKKLKDAYPFGRREHFPYKVWCEQQKLTLDTLYPEKKRVDPNEPSEGLFSPSNIDGGFNDNGMFVSFDLVREPQESTEQEFVLKYKANNKL